MLQERVRSYSTPYSREQDVEKDYILTKITDLGKISTGTIFSTFLKLRLINTL